MLRGKCKLKIGENRYFSRFRSIPRYNSTGNAGYTQKLVLLGILRRTSDGKYYLPGK
jgi:hypothetical protein